MEKINVLQLFRYFGIGGSEKAVITIAEHFDKKIFNTSICALKPGGPREKMAKKLGIKIHHVDSTEKFARLIEEKKIHVVHVFGVKSHIDYIRAAAKTSALVIIAMDNAGRFIDSETNKLFECHLISKMIALRLRKWYKMSNENFNKSRRVLYYPIKMDDILDYKISQKEIFDRRKKIGIKPNDLVIGRISRPDVGKWGNICIDMMPHLIKKVPNVKYLAMGVPDKIKEKIKMKKLEKYFIYLESPTSDEEVMKFFQLIDVFAYSSKAGESFGQTILEAMKFGKPVVVESTPLVDNAQIEQVDNGKTGFVAYYPKAFADAIAYLNSHPALIKRMGEAGYEKARRESEAKIAVRRMEKRILELLQTKGMKMPKKILDRYEKIHYLPSIQDTDNFEAEYERRLVDCFGKPNFVKILVGKNVAFSPTMQRFVRSIKLTDLRNTIMKGLHRN